MPKERTPPRSLPRTFTPPTGFLILTSTDTLDKEADSTVKRSTATTSPAPDLPEGYPEFIVSLKQRIRSVQVKAALSVNRELVLLYWQIGNDILTRQEREGWGAKVIDRLSADLLHEFPDMKGFSVRNLKYMRKFAGAWRDSPFVQQVAAQIPWFHHNRYRKTNPMIRTTTHNDSAGSFAGTNGSSCKKEPRPAKKDG